MTRFASGKKYGRERERDETRRDGRHVLTLLQVETVRDDRDAGRAAHDLCVRSAGIHTDRLGVRVRLAGQEAHVGPESGADRAPHWDRRERFLGPPSHHADAKVLESP